MPPRRVVRPTFDTIEDPTDVGEYRKRLQLAAERGVKDDELLRDALDTAVFDGCTEVVKYLLNEEHTPVDELSPVSVSRAGSIEVIQVLLDHGWDINFRKPRNMGDGTTLPGPSLLRLAETKDDLTDWCLEHGASVHDDYMGEQGITSLTESAAMRGSLYSFKKLLDAGANLDRKVLHLAVGSASSSKSQAQFDKHMAKICFLIEERQVDVNELDTPRDQPLPNHFGTPLCYATRDLAMKDSNFVAHVVRYLLDHEADPTIKDCWDLNDAIGHAEKARSQAPEIVQMLEEAAVK